MELNIGLRHHMKLHIMSLHELIHLLDYTMPGMKGMLASWNEGNRKDKLSDFMERFWHYDMITALSENEFIEKYKLWAKDTEAAFSMLVAHISRSEDFICFTCFKYLMFL